MVDKDKIKEKLGGGSGDKKKKKKKSGSKKKKSGSSGGSSKSGEEMTKKQKMDKLKGKSSPDSGDGTEDIKTVLFTIASMELYTTMGKGIEYEDENPARRKKRMEAFDKVNDKIIELCGVFDIPEICEKYGYSWDNIMDHIASYEDYSGNKMGTNAGNVSSEDMESALKCVANILLYAEGLSKAFEEKDEDKMDLGDEVFEQVFENVYGKYKDIISKCRVQKVAEANGYDWKEDIIKYVISDQDYEKQLGI